jgi:excinuclease ABC subunit C
MSTGSALYRCKARLKERLAALPAAPGIYRFYDVSGAIVYVGKSISLRDRVRSYFTGKAATKKLRRMRQEVSELDWSETGSELEALLLESQLVKRHHPRFNVMLREFFPRPYVRVDLHSAFPRLEITRQPKRDGASYFGPFRSQSTLETAVGALADALQLRDCDTPEARLAAHGPCYRHELGTCSAPCLGAIETEAYHRALRTACAAFEGQSDGALAALRLRMEQSAERLQFEIAARLRDAIRSVEAVAGRQHALLSAVEELSLVAACPSRHRESLCLFVFRSGRLAFQEDVVYTDLNERETRRAWVQRLLQAERPTSEPRNGIDTTLLDEIQIITAWMKQRTREGSYLRLDERAAPQTTAVLVDEWILGQLVDQTRQLAA